MVNAINEEKAGSGEMKAQIPTDSAAKGKSYRNPITSKRSPEGVLVTT